MLFGVKSTSGSRTAVAEQSGSKSQLTGIVGAVAITLLLVLAPDLEVRLEVLGHRPATLSLDGQNVGELVPGDAVVCTASPTVARLVTLGPRDFHRILKTKFGLPDR